MLGDMKNQYPFLIQFASIGNSALGYLSVAEQQDAIPFNIARVYWTYFTPQNVTRGGHANIEKELVLVAVAGSITVTTEMRDGTTSCFVLDNPSKGLYIPNLCWHTMQYSHNAVQMVIASNLYSEEDYIRDYDSFKSWR
jgi:dTDP-4-dehydrorhamnose 3,5-epimerase-like enzyme